MKGQYRTDLASEALNAEKINSRTSGLLWEEETLYGLSVLKVEITGEEAAARLSKPTGTYYTLRLPDDCHRKGESFPSAVKAIAQLLRRCFGTVPNSCLIAALGNPDITPDAVGPICASHILVTRHLKEQGVPAFESFSSVSLCRTGVLGTTGIESAKQIRLLCTETRPDFVIAVDALAASEADSLCRTVQICSSGIAPGSGVGNDRMALNEETLGCPVIALGVPTVIDAGSISSDAGLCDMFVTPRGIDSLVRNCARIIAYSINISMHPGLGIEDVDMLLG